MAHHKLAKVKMAELMLSGKQWREAAQEAQVTTSQTSAYRFLTAYCCYGERALEDGRRGGQAYKVDDFVLPWLLAECQAKPDISARELRWEIYDRFGVQLSKRHLNRVRAAHGVSRPKKKGV